MNGVFAHRQHAEEVQSLLAGNFRQFALVTVDLSKQGFPVNSANRGLYEVEGNGIILAARVLDADGKNELVSSVLAGPPAARIYVKVNHLDNPWIPLSLVANSLDFSAIVGTIARFWIYVPNALAGGNNLYLIVTKGISLQGSGATGGASGGGYGTPSVSSGLGGGGTGFGGGFTPA